MDDFHRANLTHQCAKFAHLVIVLELPNVHFQSCHVEKADTDFVAVFLNSEHVLGLVRLLLAFESSLRYHVAYLPIHDFVGLGLIF